MFFDAIPSVEGPDVCTSKLNPATDRNAFVPQIPYTSAEYLSWQKGATMGREEKRVRERAAKQLMKRLRREPTEEEIENELAGLRKAQGLVSHQDRKR